MMHTTTPSFIDISCFKSFEYLNYVQLKLCSLMQTISHYITQELVLYNIPTFLLLFFPTMKQRRMGGKIKFSPNPKDA